MLVPGGSVPDSTVSSTISSSTRSVVSNAPFAVKYEPRSSRRCAAPRLSVYSTKPRAFARSSILRARSANTSHSGRASPAGATHASENVRLSVCGDGCAKPGFSYGAAAGSRMSAWSALADTRQSMHTSSSSPSRRGAYAPRPPRIRRAQFVPISNSTRGGCSGPGLVSPRHQPFSMASPTYSPSAFPMLGSDHSRCAHRSACAVWWYQRNAGTAPWPLPAPPCCNWIAAAASVRPGSFFFMPSMTALRMFRMARKTSRPATGFIGKRNAPSNMPVTATPMPVPFLPQLPVSASSRHIARSIRSPW